LNKTVSIIAGCAKTIRYIISFAKRVYCLANTIDISEKSILTVWKGRYS
jgi:hypothetical protein